MTTARNRTLTGTVIRSGLAMLALLTLVAVVVHAAVVYRQGVTSHRRKLEFFVRQGIGQLAELGGRQNTAMTTSWETTDGPLITQFRCWAWSVLRDEDVIGLMLLDEQSRPMITVPQDVEVPRESFAHGNGEDVAADLVMLPFGDRQELLWRVVAVTRRDSSADSQTGLVLYAHRRPTLREAGCSALWLAGALLAMDGGLMLIYGLWFRRRVSLPLSVMAIPPGSGAGAAPGHLPVERDDEIGHVARTIRDLIRHLERSEGHTERLEQTMHSRVNDQTRRINVMLQRAERASWVDPLTRLGNRRLLEERLERIFKAQQRTGQDLCMVMLDLDNFKNLNDTRGHAAGDRMIEFVGELLRGTLRPTDLGIRYGGDEFAVILLDTTPRAAAAFAERISRLFSQRAAVMNLDPPVSMSAGIASMLENRPNSGKHLLELADQALYKAKSGGKNRLCVQ
ncbi:MAG: diguanylate cyclase [Phycisphaerae bacterium]|nr:diguanylate cyclase [Phycisphaerae bacterium]